MLKINIKVSFISLNEAIFHKIIIICTFKMDILNYVFNYVALCFESSTNKKLLRNSMSILCLID